MAYAQAMNPDPRTQRLDKGPWYREPWPWIIMAGPAVVVVAGVVTAWIAFSGADGLVADDYYKQGLAINKVLAREQRAAFLGERHFKDALVGVARRARQQPALGHACDDLIHGLRRHEEAAGEIGGGQARMALHEREDRILDARDAKPTQGVLQP